MAKVITVALNGVKALKVDCQVTVTPGLPAFNIVGLPDKSVSESRERIRAALYSVGLSLPPKRLTVNLAPADIVKEGSGYDLPIAIGIMIAIDALPSDSVHNKIVVGELGLDGELAPVSGVLPAALLAKEKLYGLICPWANGGEAKWVGALDIMAATNILDLINAIHGRSVLAQPEKILANEATAQADMQDVKAQPIARFGAEVAAAGGHNLLMIGPPGTGKSLLAMRMAGIMPPLTSKEALETSIVNSVSGILHKNGMCQQRPFRAPHHSASMVSLVGGGHRAMPGEVSLAHNGVLFLDELPEFQRTALEALRQPLETGRIHITRANAQAEYPARFQLVAAMNPCRCGYAFDETRRCHKLPRCMVDYQAKISGPFWDRMDVFVEMSDISISMLQNRASEESSAEIAKRVQAAHIIQRKRNPNGALNAWLDGKDLEELCQLDSDGMDIINKAESKFQLSARGYHRLLKVARSIADLENSSKVLRPHLASALSLRRRYDSYEQI